MTRDISASVRGRLENLAKQASRPLQELMQYFAMERFLYRLSQSRHGERFVLKGALMFTVWGTPQSRATRDIDLLARANNSVEAMSKMITDICQHPVEPDGVEFVANSVTGAVIKQDAEYSGVRVTFKAMIQNARLPMQIDIGLAIRVCPILPEILRKNENRPTFLSVSLPVVLEAQTEYDFLYQVAATGFEPVTSRL